MTSNHSITNIQESEPYEMDAQFLSENQKWTITYIEGMGVIFEAAAYDNMKTVEHIGKIASIPAGSVLLSNQIIKAANNSTGQNWLQVGLDAVILVGCIVQPEAGPFLIIAKVAIDAKLEKH